MPNYLIEIKDLGELIKALAAVAGCHNAEALANAMTTRRSGDGISKSAVERWFKNENRPDLTHRTKLLNFFLLKGLFQDKMDDDLYIHFVRLLNTGKIQGNLYDLRSKTPGILDFYSLNKVKWTTNDAVDHIFRLDFEEYDGITTDNEGTAEQWLPAFEQYPDTWRILVSRQRLIGYWQYCVFLPDFYRTVKSGGLMEGLIDPLKVFDAVDLPGIYNLYILSMVISRAHRNPLCRRILIDSFFRTIGELAEKDIFFKEITTNAYSAEGLQMCRSFGMEFVCNHQHSGAIYSAPTGLFLDRYKVAINRYVPLLIDKYKEAGLY